MNKIILNDTEQMLVDILATKGIGSISFFKLLKKYKTIEEIYKNLKPARKTISSDCNVKLITYYDKLYPQKLKKLYDYPPIIWAIGNIELLQQQSIAIVGGRNASLHGINFSKFISKQASENKYCIVSGLARGIDRAAHLGAINFATIAVLAGGVDKLYPKENIDLYEKIKADHLIISESFPQTEPIAQLFPRRNRLIAALSEALCVIEAAKGSGSLITVRNALEIGISIFATPGHPFDPRVKGCNQLIKEGAYLLEDFDDLESVLNMNIKNNKQLKDQHLNTNILKQPINSSNIEDLILKNISHTSIDMEELISNLSNYNIQEISNAVAKLELKQKIFLDKLNRISLAP